MAERLSPAPPAALIAANGSATSISFGRYPSQPVTVPETPRMHGPLGHRRDKRMLPGDSWAVSAGYCGGLASASSSATLRGTLVWAG